MINGLGFHVGLQTGCQNPIVVDGGGAYCLNWRRHLKRDSRARLQNSYSTGCKSLGVIWKEQPVIGSGPVIGVPAGPPMTLGDMRECVSRKRSFQASAAM